MTTIQIASDLHIDYYNISDPLEFITPSADILILAGDIGSLYKIDQLTEFLQALCLHFHIVLYIPGNHEWYIIPDYVPLSQNELKKRIYDMERKITNLYILDKASVRIGNICIAGCTLWSKPECKIPSFIVRIHGMHTKKYQKKHNNDVFYLKKMIKYCKKNNYKLLVITHHLPTFKVFNNAKNRKFISLYATDLDYMLDKDQVDTWVCGHIHKSFDFISENGCRIVGNQKGKPKDQNINYKKDFLITV